MAHQVVLESVSDVVLEAIVAAGLLFNLDCRTLLFALEAEFAGTDFRFFFFCSFRFFA